MELPTVETGNNLLSIGTIAGAIVASLYGIARVFLARLVKQFDELTQEVRQLERDTQTKLDKLGDELDTLAQEHQGAYALFVTKSDMDKVEARMDERIKYLERR